MPVAVNKHTVILSDFIPLPPYEKCNIILYAAITCPKTL